MGQKLAKIFELVQADMGIQGKMRLAMKTCVSSNAAMDTPDSPENVAKFKDAFKEITGKDCPVD